MWIDPRVWKDIFDIIIKWYRNKVSPNKNKWKRSKISIYHIENFSKRNYQELQIDNSQVWFCFRSIFGQQSPGGYKTNAET